jgi:epoxide hydrolase A/B
MVASNTALLRPDVVRGLVCVAIPPIPRGPAMTVTEQRFGKGFYRNHLQKPGAEEASLEKGVAATFRLAFGGVRNSGPSEDFLGLFLEPEALPDWLTDEDQATFVDQFTASGFAGGLNWYRNLDRNWEQTAAWQDVPITAPTLYITGEQDAMRVVYPLTDAVRAIVPNLRGVVDVPDCAHRTCAVRPGRARQPSSPLQEPHRQR